MKYFFNWDEEKKFDIGPHYSSAHGSLIKGERMQVALVHKEQGTGSRLHTHPNEQFNYVLAGELKAKVNNEEKVVKEGDLVHIPANAEHYMVAISPGGADYYVVKDTSWGIAGDAVDGNEAGPHFEPGYEK